MQERANICGILPITSAGPLGLPYPVEMYSVQERVLVMDYALMQFANAGISQVFIPVSTKDMEWFSRYIGYLRYGLTLEYIEVPPGVAHNFYRFVEKAAYRASRRNGLYAYVVLNAKVFIPNGDWLSQKLDQIEAPYHLGITDSFYLTDDSVRILRRSFKEGAPEVSLAEIFGTRYLDPPDYVDLSQWAGVKAFYGSPQR